MLKALSSLRQRNFGLLTNIGGVFFWSYRAHVFACENYDFAVTVIFRELTSVAVSSTIIALAGIISEIRSGHSMTHHASGSFRYSSIPKFKAERASEIRYKSI